MNYSNQICPEKSPSDCYQQFLFEEARDGSVARETICQELRNEENTTRCLPSFYPLSIDCMKNCNNQEGNTIDRNHFFSCDKKRSEETVARISIMSSLLFFWANNSFTERKYNKNQMLLFRSQNQRECSIINYEIETFQMMSALLVTHTNGAGSCLDSSKRLLNKRKRVIFQIITEDVA